MTSDNPKVNTAQFKIVNTQDSATDVDRFETVSNILTFGPIDLSPVNRPAPTPTCAGITPSFEWLVRGSEADKSRRQKAKRQFVKRLVRQTRNATAAIVKNLLDRIEILEHQSRQNRDG